VISSAIAQGRHVRAYCDRQQVAERTQVNIPGFLLRFCGEDPELKPFIRKMHGLHILHLEKKNKGYWNGSGLDRALQADGYEEMLSVKDDGEQVGIYFTGTEDRIRSIMLAVDSQDELVLLAANVNMTMEQLSDLVAGNGKKSLKGLVSLNK
jgi:hypothetical protein